MADNVIYFTSSATKTSDEPAKKAEQHRQEMAGRLAKEAAQIKEWLRAQKRVPPTLRGHFGRIVHRMFNELDVKGKGLVASVLAEAGEGAGDSTKCRGRFAQNGRMETPLAASGIKWLNVVCAAGRHLRGEHQALVELVAGTEYAQGSQPVLGAMDDSAEETAGHLNLLASWVNRRNRLRDYFEALRASEFVMRDGEVVPPDVLPLAADPDVIADGFWLTEDTATIVPFVPQVRLIDLGFSIPAIGTLGDRDERSAEAAVWDAVAATNGITDLCIDLKVRVSIGIAPLEPGADPVACFLVAPVFTIPVWDTTVEILPSGASGWTPFSYVRAGRTRWSAVRVADWPADAVTYVGHAGETRADAVTVSSCLNVLGARYRYGAAVLYIHDPDDSDVAEDGRVPTGAPSRSVLAAVQRNLAHSPAPLKISTMLNECAERLVRRLETVRLRERGRFDDAMTPLLAAWRDEVKGE